VPRVNITRQIKTTPVGKMPRSNATAGDDIHLHTRLQRQLCNPICLDENIRQCGDVDAALGLGGCRIINVKPGRVAGHKRSEED
jgi:L-alanine-DL-glutamate epimerase-like enolase superfamily enzyme